MAPITADDDIAGALADAADGGTVRVPPGVHESGPLELPSDVTLELAPGAVLRGPESLEEYGDASHLLSADGAENVTVTGAGTIDARGRAFMTDEPIGLDIPGHSARQGAAYPVAADEAPLAPRERPDGLLRFTDCSGVTVEGVTVRDSPAWTLHFRRCEDVRVSGVAVDNDRRVPNSDGVVPDMCRDVRISDCSVRTGDDAIAVKATGAGEVRPCENVTATNCVLSSRSGAVFVGGRAAADIRHVHVSNCAIRGSNRGVAVRAYGPGGVERVRFADLTVETRLFPGNWWGQAEPVFVASHPHRPGVDCGGVRDVTVDGLTAAAEGGVFVYGHESAPVEDLTLEGVSLRIAEGEHSESVGGNFDLRWIRDADAPATDTPPPDVYEHDIPGVYARGVQNLTLRAVTVEWDDPPAYCSNAVACEHADGVTVDGLVGRQAHPDGDAAVIAVRSARGLRIRDATASAGAGTFLALVDTDDERLCVGNDLVACHTTGPVDAFANSDADR